MPQPTPDHVRRRIIELYVVSLLSMREIATQTGCSVSNVSNVLKEEERRDPSLSKIRDICNILNESNITPLEFERYVNFLSKFDDHDINLDIFSKFLPILEEYGSDAGSIMKAAIQLYELVKETGKSYHELLQEYKNKLELLTRMEGNLSELKPKEDMLRSSIRWLEASKVLQDTLDANNIDISTLSQFIEIHEGLREMGFNLHVASALAKVLSKLGLTPMRAVAQLEKILAKCPDLMMTINQLEEEERNISAKVSLLNDQVKISAQNKANIEELVRVLYETKSIEEANISSLQGENMKLEQDIQDKKQSLSDLEEAFHKIEDTLESKATVAIVAWLMTKPENAGGREEVFSVMLALLEGFDTYTKANRTSIRHFQKISKLIEELKKMIADELWDK